MGFYNKEILFKFNTNERRIETCRFELLQRVSMRWFIYKTKKKNTKNCIN